MAGKKKKEKTVATAAAGTSVKKRKPPQEPMSPSLLQDDQSEVVRLPSLEEIISKQNSSKGKWKPDANYEPLQVKVL